MNCYVCKDLKALKERGRNNGVILCDECTQVEEDKKVKVMCKIKDKYRKYIMSYYNNNRADYRGTHKSASMADYPDRGFTLEMEDGSLASIVITTNRCYPNAKRSAYDISLMYPTTISYVDYYNTLEEAFDAVLNTYKHKKR